MLCTSITPEPNYQPECRELCFCRIADKEKYTEGRYILIGEPTTCIGKIATGNNTRQFT